MFSTLNLLNLFPIITFYSSEARILFPSAVISWHVLVSSSLEFPEACYINQTSFISLLAFSLKIQSK
jgi:hypothetical protein